MALPSHPSEVFSTLFYVFFCPSLQVAQQEQKGAASRDPALHLQLQTVLEELQEKRKDGEEQPPELAGTQKENPSPS